MNRIIAVNKLDPAEADYIGGTPYEIVLDRANGKRDSVAMVHLTVDEAITLHRLLGELIEGEGT